MPVINYVVTQKAYALSAGIAIVRQILKDHQFPNGFTTKRIFELSQNYPAPPKFMPLNAARPNTTAAPRPDHPIRSVCFLKTMILPALAGQQEIRTVVQPRSGAHPPPDLSNMRPIRRKQRTEIGNEFVWKVIPPEERKVPNAVERKKPVGVEVDVAADTSHLNKRREKQRARVIKVTEAVLKLKGGLRFSKELEEVASISRTSQ